MAKYSEVPQKYTDKRINKYFKLWYICFQWRIVTLSSFFVKRSNREWKRAKQVFGERKFENTFMKMSPIGKVREFN